MKQISLLMKVIVLGVSLFTFALPKDARAVSTHIGSNTTWTVFDANGNSLGNAQNVCLDATAPSPSNCPVGAMSYGYALPGWIADLSSIPSATWIWAPNITGTTSPAANAEFTFQKQFYLCGEPQAGTISIAADDEAEVFINGDPIPVLTAAGHDALNSITIPASKLAKGLNVIQVKVKNGDNPADCGSGQYQCNPAGMVLGASFADALTEWPKCTGTNGQRFEAWTSEPLGSCPVGQEGSKSRLCACFNNNSLWIDSSTCTTPPVQCTGSNGKVNVGVSEPQSCPDGLNGSASHTCQSNGSWGPIDASACTPPPPTCTGNNGIIFGVNELESISCPLGLIGAASRTCLSKDSWGPTDFSGCRLPEVGMGEICRDEHKVEIATCPTGATCGPRRGSPRPRPDWCPIVGVLVPFPFNLLFPPDACTPSYTQTANWFCDPG